MMAVFNKIKPNVHMHTPILKAGSFQLEDWRNIIYFSLPFSSSSQLSKLFSKRIHISRISQLFDKPWRETFLRIHEQTLVRLVAQSAMRFHSESLCTVTIAFTIATWADSSRFMKVFLTKKNRFSLDSKPVSLLFRFGFLWPVTFSSAKLSTETLWEIWWSSH